MNLKYLSLVFFMSLWQYSLSQTNDRTIESNLKTHASTMALLFKSGDFKGYIKYLHPIIIVGAGGEAKMIESLNKQSLQLRSKDVVINSIIFNQPSEIVRTNNELQCTIAQHTELKSAKGRVVTYSTLIAISMDNGKNWKFIDTSNMDISTVRKLFPNLSSKITLPPKQKPMVYPV